MKVAHPILSLALVGLACDDGGNGAQIPVQGGTPNTPATNAPANSLPEAPPAPEPAAAMLPDSPSAQHVDSDASASSVAPTSTRVAATDAGVAPLPSPDASSAPVPVVEPSSSPLPDSGATGDAGSPPLLDSFRLVVIGSSTAAGEGASRYENGWVSLLGSSLSDVVQADFDLENLSTGGLASDALVPGSGHDGGIDAALAEDPDLVLVALAGSNDLSAGTSRDEFLERLSAIRDAAEQEAVPAFFVSTAPKDLSDEEQEALADWSLAMREEFEPCWVPHSAAPYSPCFIDVFDALANDSLGIASDFGSGDGIHLNDEGHAVIFEIAEQVVRPYVCSVVACKP